jgi:hypothetical protein
MFTWELHVLRTHIALINFLKSNLEKRIVQIEPYKWLKKKKKKNNWDEHRNMINLEKRRIFWLFNLLITLPT